MQAAVEVWLERPASEICRWLRSEERAPGFFAARWADAFESFATARKAPRHDFFLMRRLIEWHNLFSDYDDSRFLDGAVPLLNRSIDGTGLQRVQTISRSPSTKPIPIPFAAFRI